MTPDELLDLIEVLNPDERAGPADADPSFRRRTDRGDACRRWSRPSGAAAGPCSGAAIRCTATRSLTQSGIKTRDFDDILGELDQAFEIHRRLGSILGGVHFELTGENVTECIGGARGLTESDLGKAYHSDVDPRLNYEQAMEMALLIARRMV